jgi:chitodextrinase
MSVRPIPLVAILIVINLVFSAVAMAAPNKGGALSAPTNLRITASTDTSVSLAWDASSGKTGSFWYCVQHGGAGCVRVDPPQTTLTRTGLLADRTHTFSVYAIDAQGHRSANSNTVSFTTPPDTTAPSPAPTLSAAAVLPTFISVSWTASVDNLSQVWYTLFVDGIPDPFTTDVIGLRFATILYLEAQSTHEFRVTARDAYGNNVESNVLSVTTPATSDTAPPTAPTNLRLSFQSTDFEEAWLLWDASTDDTDPQSLLLYEIYQNGVLTPDGGFGSGAGITYCREPGPTSITVRAVDTSGNRSGPSNAIAFPC